MRPVSKSLLVSLGLTSLLLASRSAWAVGADSTALLRISARLPERIVAYSFANDAPFRTDYYFTQGMSLTVVLPWFERLPTRRLLLGQSDQPTLSNQYGVRVRYNGFTPLRIQDPFIRFGDRPYASYIYATLFHSRTNYTGSRLTAGLQLGIIGPAVGAKGFQTAVHRWIDSPTPRGWDFQVRNDVVLGYEILVEQMLLTDAQKRVEVIATARVALSTLQTEAAAGAVVRLGLFNPYFRTLLGVSTDKREQPVQVYVEARAEAQAVGYDATMQGGLFNRSSPYTLPASTVRRGVATGSTALVLGVRRVTMRGKATWVTPEIQGGRSHAWGQIDFTAAF